MSYVISSDLLDVDFRQQHIFDLLQKHINGEDISRSDVWEWAQRTLKRGAWFYGIEKINRSLWEEAIQQRQQHIIALFEDIRENGYNGSTISIYFDKVTGEVHTYDGFHRLSIIKFLKRRYNMNCVVSYHHPTDPNQRGDFPLAERLKELNGDQEHLYQPCEDPRVSGWGVWRPDSEARLNAFSGNLVEGSVLDCGCGSGWFSRQLARRGYKVTSLEVNQKRLAVARYLSITQNLKINHVSGKWQNHILNQIHYDNILMLSVLHHDMLARCPKKVFFDLEILRNKCNRLIVEFPLRSDSIAWTDLKQKNKWQYSLETFISKLAEATSMKFYGITFIHPARPIITMVSM